MQTQRLFEIIYILLEKKSVTARELAQRFEVSTRTIYRDIDTLSAAGIPVYAVQGKGGGISLLSQYVLDKALISDEEQRQILLSLQGLSATGLPGLQMTLDKLSTLFRQSDSQWIEVDFSRWGSHMEDREKFELLKNAVARREAVRFRYFSADSRVQERTVYPLKLVFKARSWYLQGYCRLRRDYRTFKVVRMQKVKRTGESYDPARYLPALPPVEDPGDCSNPPGPPPARPDVRLLIRFAPQAAYRLLDEFGPDNLMEEPGGSFLVTVEFPRDNWLTGFLLSFGEWAEVLDPPEIRETLRKQGEALAKIYAKPRDAD